MSGTPLDLNRNCFNWGPISMRREARYSTIPSPTPTTWNPAVAPTNSVFKLSPRPFKASESCSSQQFVDINTSRYIICVDSNTHVQVSLGWCGLRQLSVVGNEIISAEEVCSAAEDGDSICEQQRIHISNSSRNQSCSLRRGTSRRK
jgi:hypothetical protein